ncbi:dynactin subunit 2-A [Eurytemora carolleeae]|uniref:dynactin subunit 2-A n=1 Tax=Eurytemora carolleeae TaxID=1294199 RepID=UPI000C78D3C2|nr:dynactin subunit 2-A [Eurytemora carolleeae]|eukprot:XP_023336967.1 dynactin subunit 2-A-like [Eurytemora affinis]
MGGTKGPGIDLENSDVFETSEQTEADQHYFPETDESSASIETIHVSTNEAFGRFKGSLVDTASVDFSDRIRNTRRKGYIVWKGEDENKKEETVVQKYQRLNAEVRELSEDIQEAQRNKDSSLETGTLESLSSQVELLHKHLVEIRLEQVLGKETLETMTDPEAAVRKRLLSQLNQMKDIQVELRAADNANTKSSARFNYNLMMKPSTSRLQAQSGIARLSARIGALEKLIGDNPEDLSVLNMETGRKSLTEAVSVLSSKTTILEPKNLDHIEGRLAVLHQKLDNEGEQSVEEDKTAMDKIKELVKLSDKSTQWAAEIPDILDRMEALSPLHTEAADLTQSLLELETVQTQLLTQLSNNSTLLKEIENKFQENLTNIERNFDNIDSRVKAIQAIQTKK